ncbi:TPA: hypothetical protein N2D99_002381 [Clostridium botulinum]|nr:hypothetical protein [Clostridium botulinum]
MDISLIIQIIILTLCSALSNTIGTLKNNFAVKGFLKPLYITTFIDALVFGIVIKNIASGSGLLQTLAFAFGKVLGSYFASKMEKRMALGIIEVDTLFNNKLKAFKIADNLRNIGYSVESMVEYGYRGQKRYLLRVTIARKELNALKSILKKEGYVDPTLKIKEINKISGKFSINY